MLSSLRLLLLSTFLGLAAFLASSSPSVEPGTDQYRLYLPLASRGFFIADQRYGLIASGDVTDAAIRLGAQWWFRWGQPTPGGPYYRVGQVSLRNGSGQISRVPVGVLQDGARANPGGHWIIGNEPNVPGQDNVSADQYAAEFKYYADTIKAADPTAKLVAPNILNFDFTCSGCPGFLTGRAWVDSFRAAWAARYGGEPPVDVWGLHAYLITWDKLPMTDYQTVQQQIAAFSDYLGQVPAHQTKPIWVTEFGVIWAYTSYTWVNGKIAPAGDFDSASVRTFLDQMLGWLESNATRYRLGKWFVYTTYGQPEPYATAYGGISLMGGLAPGSPLTEFGQLYRQYAMP